MAEPVQQIPDFEKETAEQLADWARQLREHCSATRKAALDASNRAKQFIDDAKRHQA